MNTYTNEIEKQCILKLQDLLSKMPSFCTDYFNGIEKADRTRVGYCRNIYTFLQFITLRNPIYKDYKIKDLPIQVLGEMTPADFGEYKKYLQFYTVDGIEYRNSKTTIARNLSAISSMYNYFLKSQAVTSNPLAVVERPEIKRKEIIALNTEQIQALMHAVEFPENMTKRQESLHKLTVERDKAILSVFLGTGMRISELIGLDLNHIDFNEQTLKITRKGGDEEFVYFGEEVSDALMDYLIGDDYSDDIKIKSPREKLLKEGNLEEKALFLSLRGKRMAVRSIEVMVEKYSQMINTNKKITPHKLRSTYGTDLYKKTGDIYLVASVLGHDSVETTQQRYVQRDATNRKKAATISPLSKDFYE